MQRGIQVGQASARQDGELMRQVPAALQLLSLRTLLCKVDTCVAVYIVCRGMELCIATKRFC